MSDEFVTASDGEAVENQPSAGSSGEAVPGGSGELSSAAASEGVAPAPSPAEETVDAVPVLAEVRPLVRSSGTALPAVQAAAVAATGFLAGAATIALVKRRSARRVLRSHRANPARPGDLLPIVGSRTFIVDVHLLAKPE